jgi:chromosome segregation ATPase
MTDKIEEAFETVLTSLEWDNNSNPLHDPKAVASLQTIQDEMKRLREESTADFDEPDHTIRTLQSQLTETRVQRDAFAQQAHETAAALTETRDQLEKAKAALEQERAIKTALLDSGRRETDG